MSRLLALVLALCLAPAVVYGQFGRPGDFFIIHHSLGQAAGAGGFFTGQVANPNTPLTPATPARLTQTLELGTNYTFTFAADTNWVAHPLVFTSDAFGGNGTFSPPVHRSVPVGPWPATGGAGFSLNFIVSTQIAVGTTIYIQSPDRAGEGFGFPLVVQAAPFIAPATAAPTADVIIANPNFGRAGDFFSIHHSAGLVAGVGFFQFIVNGVGGKIRPDAQTLEGGTAYTFTFGTDTNWVEHPIVFTADPVGGLGAGETVLAGPAGSIPVTPFPGAAGGGSNLTFVVPTALIGGSIYIQSPARAGEGSRIRIVSQIPPFPQGTGPAFQDPAVFPAAILPVAPGGATPASSTGSSSSTARGNGADSATPLAFVSIVALSLALVSASKYL